MLIKISACKCSSLVATYLVTDIYEDYQWRQSKDYISIEDAMLWVNLVQNEYNEKYSQATSSMSFSDKFTDNIKDAIILKTK